MVFRPIEIIGKIGFHVALKGKWGNTFLLGLKGRNRQEP